MKLPELIQGGMGAGVSGWRLARSVASRGQLGVVSGTVLDLILVRRLQLGDPDGDLRRALAAFPDQTVAERILDRYFVAGGKAPDQAFANKPMVGHKTSRDLEQLLVVANFVEVFLARENHQGLVGINFLNKVQAPMLPSLYGAMLAGVAVVIVGAGIPLEIPWLLDSLVRGEKVELKLQVRGAQPGSEHKLAFDPATTLEIPPPPIQRPLFFPIVSSATLANLLVKKSKGGVDGLIIEGATAGGHNAPPRGPGKLSASGEPVYGQRDVIDLSAIKSLGLPFWLAGSFGSPGKLVHARAAGAAGIQVGTLFAFCEESGLKKDIKSDVISRCLNEVPRVFTDPIASPTGFPFKVLPLPNTLSEAGVYEERHRVCDLGYLREAYERPNGSVAWRCPSDDREIFVRSGGALKDTEGRKCLCNALMANIGLAQVRENYGEELPLLTCGDDISSILKILKRGDSSYSAAAVIEYLLAGKQADFARVKGVLTETS